MGRGGGATATDSFKLIPDAAHVWPAWTRARKRGGCAVACIRGTLACVILVFVCADDVRICLRRRMYVCESLGVAGWCGGGAFGTGRRYLGTATDQEISNATETAGTALSLVFADATYQVSPRRRRRASNWRNGAD